jgi:hypothetical protein
VEHLRLVFGSRRSGGPDAGDPSFQHGEDFLAQLLRAIGGPKRQFIRDATEGGIVTPVLEKQSLQLRDCEVKEQAIHVGFQIVLARERLGASRR